MSKFFLNNESLNVDDFEVFKNGVIELMKIEKKQDHIFYRNDTCYDLVHFSEKIFPNLYYDRDIFIIHDFFTKLSPCEEEIQDEDAANKYCSSDVNGFIGINFNSQAITPHKKVVDASTYNQWIQFYQTNFEQLKTFLQNCKTTKNFEKNYASLSSDAQKSIKEGFEKAANRNLVTRFYPDTKIVKDVSMKKSTVWELRVYSPIDLRVYFNEIGGTVYLASIGQKSNPNQNEDIMKAAKLLSHLISS